MCKQSAITINIGGNYFEITQLWLASLKRHYPKHPDIIILYRGLSGEQKLYFDETPGVQTVNVDSYDYTKGPNMLNLDHYDSKVFYARFLIWTDLFAEYEKVLYIDVDCLVMAPLDSLFEQNEFLIYEEAFHTDDSVLQDQLSSDIQNKLIEDGIAALPNPAGNAGLFMVPQKLRTPEHRRLLNFLLSRYHEHLIWGDQSVLNLWMTKLNLKPKKDFRFNFQIRLFDQKREYSAYKDMYLLHFNGMNTSNYLLLMMKLGRLLFAIPLVGRWLYYGTHRFLFTQNQLRFKKLGNFLNWLQDAL